MVQKIQMNIFAGEELAPINRANPLHADYVKISFGMDDNHGIDNFIEGPARLGWCELLLTGSVLDLDKKY
jgi:hypothetical protein